MSEARELFEPYRMGDLELPNRLVMAPMTRNRAPGLVANETMATYYAQRAGAGLIVTEGAQISPLAQGYQDTPGIYTEEQRDGWRRVTDAVHAAGGRIFAQLWHVGRVSHSWYHGQPPVAPSPIPVPGSAYTPEGMLPYEVPRELSESEIAGVVEEFRRATAVARDAGFDGVEVHGANGYLVDQFLRGGTNTRTDRYGGSARNRTRFLVEVMDAVSAEWPGRAGVRLSPGGTPNGAEDEDPITTFSEAAAALNGLPLAYLHLVEKALSPPGAERSTIVPSALLRPIFHGTIISTGGHTLESASATVTEGRAELAGFGRLFIANPDLPTRLAREAPLLQPRRETFYGGGEEGYIDYPALEAA